MILTFEFTLLFYLRLLSALFALALVFVLWKRRFSEGAIFLILFEFAASLWSITDGFEHAATSLELKMLWSQIGYIGSSTTTVFFLLFTLSYTQFNKYVNPFVVGLLMAIPAIAVLLVFTNSHHQLIWKSVDFYPETNDSVYNYGKFFWLYAVYEYLTLVSAIMILLFSTFKFYKIYKIQLIYLIIASILPLTTSLLYVYKLLPIHADLTPMALIFSGILVSIGIYLQRMFEVVPVARIQTINNLSDGIIVVDMDDRIVDVNEAFVKILNTTMPEVLGRPFKRFSKLFLTDEYELTTAGGYLTETTIRTDIGLKYFEVKYSPVTNSKNQLIGRIFLLHDISIRKNALDSFVQSNIRLKNEIHEKERLIADLDAYARSVAHDLKNPISGVIGLTEFIKEDILNQKNEQAFELLNMLNEQGQKMLKIVDELLLLSRIRKEDIQPIEIDMQSIVKEAINRLRQQSESRGATFTIPEQWPVVKGHTQWIEEVWVNLISNAIKYGGNPPKIIIGIDNIENGWTRFWIRDNGDGLPPELFEKLFTDFERLGHQKIEGHGLGLSITKRIIEKLGGEVSVSSQNIQGEGCIFSFTLKN
ncbi:MAG TPA: histidine kinase N-terminal 7TM domain-containing protein [Prolixibacteraceae bacterium]